MGGVTSCRRSNDDLVDSLLIRKYIRSVPVERVFRAVDRAEYFPVRNRELAYDGAPLRLDNLHISSPAIFAITMEALDLRPTLSFLNIGSGSGLLNTMVGLILGSVGVNHGIEAHADIVKYAKKKLENFKKLSGAIDAYDFCEPQFVHGDIFNPTGELSMGYDRIYCGATCEYDFISFLKERYLRIGGILIVAYYGQLYLFKRLDVAIWDIKFLVCVNFPPLITHFRSSLQHIRRIEVQPTSLQDLCRNTIRNILRRNTEMEYQPEPVITPQPSPDNSDDEFEVIDEDSRETRRVYGRDSAGRPVYVSIGVCNMSEIDRMNAEYPSCSQEEMEFNDSVSNEDGISDEVSAIIEYVPHTRDYSQDDFNSGDARGVMTESGIDDGYLDDGRRIFGRDIDGVPVSVYREVHTLRDENTHENWLEADTINFQEAMETDDTVSCSYENIDMEASMEANCSAAGGASAAASPSTSIEWENINRAVNDETIQVFSSSEEEEMRNRIRDGPCICQTIRPPIRRVIGSARYRRNLRRVPPTPSPATSTTSSDTEDEAPEEDTDENMYQSPMAKKMRDQIEELPVPDSIKRFLAFQ